MSQRIHAIHKQINEIEALFRDLRAEVALLSAESNFEALPELESVAVEEDG